jgi:hypothetical protein
MQTSSSLADGRATPQKEIHAMNFRFVYIVYFCSAILHLIQGFALLITPASLQPQAMTVQGQHFADVAPSSRPLQQTCLAASLEMLLLFLIAGSHVQTGRVLIS